MFTIRNVVFDFGGVLIDWNPELLYRKIFDTKKEMDYFLTHVCSYEWNIKQDEGRPIAEATSLLQKEHPEYRAEIAAYYGRWEEMLGGVFQENVKLIKPLKQKYHIYGLTNWSAETLPIAMHKYGFFKELDGIVVSGEEKLVKPDKRLFQILLDRYSLKPAESLFIDDNKANADAAREMGFHTIWLAGGVILEKELAPYL